MNKLGFTLVEILTAVIIITILTVVAVPLYEKTIERSHLTEMHTMLKSLQAAKNHSMDNMGCTDYSVGESSSCPLLKHLNIKFNNACPGSDTSFCSKYFRYSINPGGTTYNNGVCAVRMGGDYDGTVFMYTHAAGEEAEGSQSPGILCSGADDNCTNYGYENTSGLTCGN